MKLFREVLGPVLGRRPMAKTETPKWLTILERDILKYLSTDEAETWTAELEALFLEVKDFDNARDLFLVSTLKRAEHLDTYNVVQPVIDLLKRRLAGEDVEQELKEAARAATRADTSAAANAAWVGADVAASAAGAAANAARAAGAWADARTNADAALQEPYKHASKDLLAALEAP